jgi:hypothetical protein
VRIRSALNFNLDIPAFLGLVVACLLLRAILG